LGGVIRPAKTRPNSIERNHRSAIWFAVKVKRQGGCVILHHRHVRSVLVRDWSPAMDGIQATIWASRTTTDLNYGRPSRTTVTADVPHPRRRNCNLKLDGFRTRRPDQPAIAGVTLQPLTGQDIRIRAVLS